MSFIANDLPRFGALYNPITGQDPIMGKCSDLGMKHPNRLSTLRNDKGLTQEAAADAMGMSGGGYRKLEYGERRLKLEQIQRAAEVFGVTAAQVVGDVAEPETQSIPIMGYVGAGAEVMPDFEQVPADGLDQVELAFHVPDGIVGLGVKGDSMLPRFRDGDVLLVYAEQRLALRDYLGEEVVVRTSDGRRFVKTLLRGPDPGTFNLDSHNARMIEAVQVVWIGEIYLIVPSKQIRQIDRVEKAAATEASRRRESKTSGIKELPLNAKSA